ncbi:cd7 antigen-like [Sphaeramia orbicularis]|uniref:cd7 antigen-like n=1 Tax=Sphaeramia orbicularis TaxID=375764 RepID=UPI00117CBCD4|nr:uncharacterized protein LOC115421630 [Sphaeramia orbicularis]
MAWIQFLVCLWTLFITQTVCSNSEYFEKEEGDSVVFPCAVNQSEPPPYGFALARRWLQTSTVLYKHKHTNHEVLISDYKNRISVSGDPTSYSVTVTISELRASDTDRYHCQFEVDNPFSDDIRKPGNTEFFLLVRADASGSVDLESVNTCAGGSVVLPCAPPPGDSSAVEGVILKRRRGQAPVEVLYHSKWHHNNAHPSPAGFPVERVHLSFAPGPVGITYNLSLQQLQPEDSGLYSCQLLLQGRPHSTRLGRRAFFVSVQDGPCECTSYSALIYALSSSVAVLFILLLVLVIIHRGKRRRAVKSPPQAPIYEEMSMVQPPSRKLAPCQLAEMESEYRNCSVKKSCPENHYESPRGPPGPRDE